MSLTPDRKTPPAVADYGLLRLSEPEVTVLPSGIRVVAFDDPRSEDVAQILVMAEGSRAESADPSLAQIAMAQIVEGGAGLSGREIADRFDTAGAWLRPIVFPHRRAMLLSTLGHQIGSTLPLLLSLIADPSYPEEEFSKYCSRMAASLDISMSRNPWLAGREIDRITMGENHPLGRRSTPGSILNLTPADALSFHRSRLATSQITVYAAGRLGSGRLDKMLGMLDDFGNGLPRIEPAKPEIVAARPISADGFESFLRGEPRNQASVQVAIPLPDDSDPDFQTLIYTVKALGGYFGSRLMTRCREEKGYTYGISASVMRQPEGNFVRISTETDRRHVDAILTEIREAIGSMATVPVEADELNRMKRHSRGVKASSKENIFSQMNYYLMSDVSGFSPSEFIGQQLLLDSLSAADIAGAAGRHLSTAPLYVAVVGADS